MMYLPPGTLAQLQGSEVPAVGFRLAEGPDVTLERNTVSRSSEWLPQGHLSSVTSTNVFEKLLTTYIFEI